jgi:hypothetical protein
MLNVIIVSVVASKQSFFMKSLSEQQSVKICKNLRCQKFRYRYRLEKIQSVSVSLKELKQFGESRTLSSNCIGEQQELK